MKVTTAKIGLLALLTVIFMLPNSASAIADASTWTSGISASDNQWSSVTYGNGLFVAVSSSGLANAVMTSSNGSTWTSRASAADTNQWVSVTHGNGLFVAVAAASDGDGVMTSPDGITWTSRTPAADLNWASVTYGNGLFVAVATSGAGNRLMTSGAFVVPTTTTISSSTTIAPVTTITTTTVTLIAAVKKTESLPATGREPSTLILMGAFFAMSGVVLVGRRRFN